MLPCLEKASGCVSLLPESKSFSMQLRVQLKDVQELMSSMRFFDTAKTSHLSCFFQVSGADVGFRAWYKR